MPELSQTPEPPRPTAVNLPASSSLPTEVVQCLKNSRFLHLATCTNNLPHVSLMNYTYLPSTPYTSHPSIIMTTNPSSKKTSNLLSNPHVSLLVHDWVSHRPTVTSTVTSTTTTSNNNDWPESPPLESRGPSSLATLLANLNTSALSSISVTINGTAALVDSGTEEERYLRERHLENNTFGEGEGGEALGWSERELAGGGGAGGGGDGGRGCFIEGEEVRVVVVRISDGRVADWKGGLRDWSLGLGEENGSGGGGGGGVMVNGY